MPDFALIMTAVFGAVVATGLRALPGTLSLPKVLAMGTATVVTIFIGLILVAELRPRP
jgi:hypothetical protein